MVRKKRRADLILSSSHPLLIFFSSLLISSSSLLQLDCGIHPGLEGMDALPYIDLIDPAEIDLLLISQ